MSIIRTKRAENFTVVNNALIYDPLLDWRDLGLLIYLLSKPDEWEVSVAHLQKVRKSGRDAIYASLKTIIEAGYATRKPCTTGGWDYLVSDAPIYKLELMPHTAKAYTENPYTEKPLTENPSQVNTDTKQRLNTKQILNITTTPSEGIFENSVTSKLNAVQYEVYVWACSHEYWHKATSSEEDFLKAYCSPKGGMRKQFEQRHSTQLPIGGNHGVHRQSAKKLSPAERVRKAAGIGEFTHIEHNEHNRG
jgi:hypothetical protein